MEGSSHLAKSTATVTLLIEPPSETIGVEKSVVELLSRLTGTPPAAVTVKTPALAVCDAPVKSRAVSSSALAFKGRFLSWDRRSRIFDLL